MKKKLLTAIVSVFVMLLIFTGITEVINEDVYADAKWWSGANWCLNVISKQVYGDSSDGTYQRVAQEVFAKTVEDETSSVEDVSSSEEKKASSGVLGEEIHKEIVKEENPSKEDETDSKLIKSSLSTFNKSTPSTGDVKALVIEVEFTDLKFSQDCIPQDMLQERIFGEEDRNSPDYPLESVTAYYKRASYGNINLTGDVYVYQAQHERNYYSNDDEFETFVMEVLTGLDEQIDFAEYDGDQDGYIDCISFNVPTNGTSDDDFWYGCQATWYINKEFMVDDTKINGYIINDEQPYEYGMSVYNATLCHEIGHLMGLPDYYKYNTEDDSEGMNGSAGFERMDDSYGDFCAFSKLMLGWFNDGQVSVCDLSDDTSTYILGSTTLQKGGNMVIIPVGDLDSEYLSEYFVVEYITPENNNYGIFKEGGIRVLHIEAETVYNESTGYKMFKYENYSPYYDVTDNGRRVICLVNDANGFYTSNSVVEYGVSNFGIYDEDGKPTIDPGFCITIGELINGQYTITVQKTN